MSRPSAPPHLPHAEAAKNIHSARARGHGLFSLRIALSSLSAHKLRTALAMLGVFLGALAFTGVQHLSLAMVRKAEIETEKLGPNLFMVAAGQIRMRHGGAGIGNFARTLTPADAEALVQGMTGVAASSPVAATQMDVRRGTDKVPAQVMGVVPAYTTVRNFHPSHGRFLTDDDVRDQAMVCVLGRDIADRLFASPEDALGQLVLFYRAPCRVVGVMEAKGADIVGASHDEQVLVPITTFMRRLSHRDWIEGVYMQLAPHADPDVARASATDILRHRHRILPGERDDFSVMAAKDTIKLQRQALNLVETLGLISSTVSFAVGGLGILSIMILLVRARRLEIGVRRAVGARRRDIVGQFLLESSLMSGTGGALGVAAALGLLAVVYPLADFPFLYDPLLVLGVLAASTLLGVAAGAYPAWRAARVEVLAVLRSG